MSAMYACPSHARPARAQRARPLGAAALAMAVLCGCGTVTTRVKGQADPYCGVASDLEKVSRAERWQSWSYGGTADSCPFFFPNALLWVLDLPLSFTADTLLLPVDLLAPRPVAPDTGSEEGQGNFLVVGGQWSSSGTNSTPGSAGAERHRKP